MAKTLARACLAGVLLALGPGVASDPPAPDSGPGGRYGSTYTPEELAALDRALHAGNLTRQDLTFRKDMAKGTFCLPVVKALLADPLRIAPAMDELARAVGAEGPVDLGLNVSIDAPAGEREGNEGFALLAALGLLHDEAAGRSLLDVMRTHLISVRPPRRPSAETAQAKALEVLEACVGTPVELRGEGAADGADGENLLTKVLRRHLPAEMLMREVLPTPFDAAAEAGITSHMAGRPPSYVHELAAALHGDAPARQPRATQAFLDVYVALRFLALRAGQGIAEAFPTDAPVIRDTPHGRIALGTPKDDVYEGDFAAIVDPGGDDTYRNGRFGAAFGTDTTRVGVLIDLGGDDLYDCRDVDCTLGAAILGVGILMDLGQGNDRYHAGHLSLGAAVGGIALLHDDGGSDVYEGKTFTQGAAGFGIGILFDQSLQALPQVSTSEETKDPVAIAAWDNDRLTAWCTAQGFSRTLGVGLCINQRGNDRYEAGGVYLHAPLFADRYQSFSQGFSIGAREHDMAGGVAALIDFAGNDRYLGDIYDQGVGYWYAAGFLWDGGGHDLYEMTQYGQGSGIHLAVGGLVDAGGNDAYVMHSGLGQGGSHDFAASVLHDRGGNDRYHGNTSCNGTGLTNSVGLHIDRAGDDTYAARRDGGLNAGRPARGFGSVGLFVDLGGKDDYPPRPEGRAMEDDALWRGSDLGLGLDVPSPAATPGGNTAAADQPSGKVEVPAVCRYEGPLTPEVFRELWALSVRWEVGDNRFIVPEARKRLVAFGPDVLPLLDDTMEKDESGLELRAYVDVLQGLMGDAKPAVHALLAKNAGSDVDRRRRVALHLIGELKAVELEKAVVRVLEGQDPALARRAAGVLLQLGSRAGEAHLKAWLAPPDGDERLILAALGTLLGTEADVYAQVRPLLAHPLVSVRSRLATLLAEKRLRYGEALLGDLAATDLPDRAQRTLLDTVARGPVGATPAALQAVVGLLAHADWGVRADAARVLRLWAGLAGTDPAHQKACRGALASLLAQEQDPYVRRMAQGP